MQTNLKGAEFSCMVIDHSLELPSLVRAQFPCPYKSGVGAGGLAKCLIAFVTLIEDLSLILSTHKVGHNGL